MGVVTFSSKVQFYRLPSVDNGEVPSVILLGDVDDPFSALPPDRYNSHSSQPIKPPARCTCARFKPSRLSPHLTAASLSLCLRWVIQDKARFRALLQQIPDMSAASGVREESASVVRLPPPAFNLTLTPTPFHGPHTHSPPALLTWK